MDKIHEHEIIWFVWKNIMCWFNLSKKIITENRKQFTWNKVKVFTQKYEIKLYHSSTYYPQTNGQAESSNKLILTLLNKILESSKGKRVENLLGILWAIQTSPRLDKWYVIFPYLWNKSCHTNRGGYTNALNKHEGV